jgi:hypothetical protein
VTIVIASITPRTTFTTKATRRSASARRRAAITIPARAITAHTVNQSAWLVGAVAASWIWMVDDPMMWP